MPTLVTELLAVLGALLGVVGLWYNRQEFVVVVRVIPKSYRVLQGKYIHLSADKSIPGAGWAVEIINLSRFAVTVDDVGFSPEPARGWLGTALVHLVNRVRGVHGFAMARYSILRPNATDNGPWPRRLESRESVVVYFDRIPIPGMDWSIVRSAFVCTSCGYIAFGLSRAMTGMMSEITAEAVGTEEQHQEDGGE